MKNTKEFQFTFSNEKLPCELFSIEYIWNELKNNTELFGPIQKIENATRALKKILWRTRWIAKSFASFCVHKILLWFWRKKSYGLVGGKSNYTYPDLNFDVLNDKLKVDNRYARNFLKEKGFNWDETIIIVNHKPSKSEVEDKQAALFLECYLQRRFNLFDS